MERNPWLKALIVLLTIIAGWYLLAELWGLAMRFADIIVLFFLAWLLAFTLRPVARFLSHAFGVPRVLAVAIVYLSLLLVIFAGTLTLIPVLLDQLSQFGSNLGGYSEQVPGWIAGLQAELLRRNVDVDIAGFYGQQNLANQVERVGTLFVQNAIGIVTGIASAMFGIMLVLILSFYLMVDDGRLVRQIVRAVPRQGRDETAYLVDSIDRTFGGFIRGQLIQCLIYGVGTALVMLGAGLPYVLLSSLFAGIIMLIPFLGPVLAIVPPLLIAALQGSLATVIAVAVALLVLQQIVINVIAPKLLSQAVGLPPLLVILAMLMGAKLAGVMGAIFGVPAAAVLYAMLLFFYRQSTEPAAPAPAAPIADGAAQPVGPPMARREPERSTGWVLRSGDWVLGRLDKMSGLRPKGRPAPRERH